MSKQQYRSELGIISDVLQVTIDCGRNGAIISAIARGANLSHYTAVGKCQKLVSFGLIYNVNKEKNHTYSITEKGIQFFAEMQKFIEIAEQVKIRY